MNVKLHLSCMLHQSLKFTDYLDQRVCCSIFFINVVEVKFVKLSKNFRVIKLVTYLLEYLKELQFM